jgi:anti-anti-sigma factor
MSMDIKLVAQTGLSQGQAVAVKKEKFFIGSHCNCQLRPEIPGLAGVHALVEERAGQVMVRDMGAASGTQVNERVLHSKEIEVFDGDVLRIGPLELRFAIAPKPPEDAPCALETVPEGWPLAATAAPAPTPEPAVAAAKATVATKGPDMGLVQPPKMPGKALSYENRGSVLVVKLLIADLVDEQTVSPLRYELSGLLEEELPRRMIIDLSEVSYLSSRAVGVILAHYQRLERQGGSLRVCCAHERVLPVLEQMRLNMLVSVYPTLEEAVAEPWE